MGRDLINNGNEICIILNIRDIVILDVVAGQGLVENITFESIMKRSKGACLMGPLGEGYC